MNSLQKLPNVSVLPKVSLQKICDGLGQNDCRTEEWNTAKAREKSSHSLEGFTTCGSRKLSRFTSAECQKFKHAALLKRATSADHGTANIGHIEGFSVKKIFDSLNKKLTSHASTNPPQSQKRLSIHDIATMRRLFRQAETECAIREKYLSCVNQVGQFFFVFIISCTSVCITGSIADYLNALYRFICSAAH